jgi:hypothetical protein
VAWSGTLKEDSDEFEDAFDGDELDGRRWVEHYLPQWSSRERSAARYELVCGC